MNPITQIMAVVLAISLAANAASGWAYLGQRDKTTVATTEEKQATGAAVACSQGTEQLVKQADQRHAAAAPKIAAAAQEATAADRRADVILATPPAVPGNACASAQAELDSWWAGRAKP